MTDDASGGDEARRAYLRNEEQVRLEFRVASSEIWTGLVSLLAQRWDNADLARQIASIRVRVLSDLAKLRCLPDGRPLPAPAVLEDLHWDFMRVGKTPEDEVEQMVVRTLAGKPRSARTPAEITALIEAFLRCYAVDYERGELTWVDELYALAVPALPLSLGLSRCRRTHRMRTRPSRCGSPWPRSRLPACERATGSSWSRGWIACGSGAAHDPGPPDQHIGPG